MINAYGCAKKSTTIYIDYLLNIKKKKMLSWHFCPPFFFFGYFFPVVIVQLYTDECIQILTKHLIQVAVDAKNQNKKQRALKENTTKKI